jgi:branched-chain amino acid transport system substrate-binding protein
MFEDPEILKVAGSSAEGVIYSARAYDPESSNPTIHAFVAAFKARYGETPDIFAAFSYDAAQIMALAMKRGGTTSGGIKNALYSTKNFPGVCGQTSFDENGDVTQPAFLKTVREGKFTWLDKQK